VVGAPPRVASMLVKSTLASPKVKISWLTALAVTVDAVADAAPVRRIARRTLASNSFGLKGFVT
jgi:hypothetical protein